VLFRGQDITRLSPEKRVALGMGHVPQGRQVFPGLTVEENLRLGAFLLRKDKALLAARLDEVLDVFPALRPLLGLRAGSLSGGQRQQLVLAQAFLLKPKLLLIDELSLGLAPVIVQELLMTVRRLNKEGITVVLVEQSVNVALTLADRAYFMEKGQVRFEGPTADLLHRDDLLRSVFLGGAPALATV
jgi:branched-chain amino acid transport system ATP-binding protein